MLKKTLGLPDDQNFLFDFFELLGRPQQAMYGAIEAKLTGGDAKKAAWEHFKGERLIQKIYMMCCCVWWRK